MHSVVIKDSLVGVPEPIFASIRNSLLPLYAVFFIPLFILHSSKREVFRSERRQLVQRYGRTTH